MHHKCSYRQNSICLHFVSPTSNRKSANNKWSISITHCSLPKSTSQPKFCYCPSLDLPLGKNPTPHLLTHRTLHCVACLIFIEHGLPNSTRHLDPMIALHIAPKMFLEEIRFMLVHQFKIPKKTRPLSIANL